MKGSSPSCFRKTFQIDKTPKGGVPDLALDDDAQIYIDGSPVIDEQDCTYAEVSEVDVTSVKRRGVNLIAVKAHDTHGASEGVQINLTLIPKPLKRVSKP